MNRSVSTLIDLALDAAVRAPSPRNTKPWRFVVRDDEIELWLDRDRLLEVADPDAHEARLSCGAALFNLTVTLRAQGRLPVMWCLAEANQPDLLATIRMNGHREPSRLERKLAEAVTRRYSDRRPLRDKFVPAVARTPLTVAAVTEGGRLEYLDASERYDAVASLVRRAEFAQSTDRGFRAEKARWAARAPLQRSRQPGGAVSLRTFDPALALPRGVLGRPPLLAAVLTRGSGPRADMRAGMILQRVLLTATSVGLATSFVSQPFETPATRIALDDIFRNLGQVHTILRIGYAPAAGTDLNSVHSGMKRGGLPISG